MSTQPNLPAELYRYILEYPLTRQDYYNLCLTCKALSSEAFRVLYADVQLCGCDMIDSFITAIASSPELIKITHTLALDIGKGRSGRSLNQLRQWWKYTNRHLVKAINNMSNLRHLHLDRMWGREDMQLIHTNGRHDPWTASLVMPQLRSLHIRESLTQPLHSYFKQIPSPLPVFETLRPVDARFIENITVVRCVGIRDEMSSNLEALKTLVLDYVFSSTRRILAPNIEIVVVTTAVDMFHYDINPDELLIPFNNAKKIGLLTCSAKSMDKLISAFSQTNRLKATALFVPEDYFLSFAHTDLKRMTNALPHLQQLFLITKVFNESHLHLKTWTRSPESSAPVGDMSHQWTVSDTEDLGKEAPDSMRRALHVLFELD